MTQIKWLDSTQMEDLNLHGHKQSYATKQVMELEEMVLIM